jgi:hypothetical protein
MRKTQTELKNLRAGDIGTGLILQLAKEVPPEQIAVAIKEMLGATTNQRTGAHDYEEVPDWRAREAAVKLYLSYMLGMPVQRTEVKTQVIESEEQTLARLLGSPAVREALRRELAQEV